jgi:hypothetical protein
MAFASSPSTRQALPEIHELDLNPVIVTETRACAADVRIGIDDRTTPRVGRHIDY